MRQTSRHSFLCTISMLVLAALTLAGCADRSKADSQAAQQLPSASSDPNLFEVEHPEQFPLHSVETRKTQERLDVNGIIAPDVGLTVHVMSLSGGRIADIRAKLGDEVHAGQVLVVIRSQDLVQAISDSQKSKADELLAQKTLARSQELYENGALAQKDLQQAQDAALKAKVDLETSLERIHILGGDTNSLSPTIDIKSPISGTIVEQNAASGEGVKSIDSSSNLFTVADLSRVWLLCDVYENNLAQVKFGDSAEVRLNAYPDRILTGKISNISRILDPATRTAKVRIELDNREGLLRPNMFAVATFTSQSSEMRMVVPTAALLRLHDKDWVFRPVGGNRYRRLEVRAGPPASKGLQYVMGGLRPGDEVVSNALQFMSTVEQK